MEEMTISKEQLSNENNLLKTNNTQLKADDNVMKDNSDKQSGQIRQSRTKVEDSILIRAEDIQLENIVVDSENFTGASKLEPVPKARQKPKVSQ